MKMILSIFLAILVSLSVGFFCGYIEGEKETYQKFVSEEVWINPQSRDVEGILYID